MAKPRKKYAAWRKAYDAKNQQLLNLKHRAWKYGLSVVQLQTMLAKDVCDICMESCEVVIDHCHTTNVVRGGLCSTCNVAIGMMKDNALNLRRAADYLEAKSRSANQ